MNDKELEELKQNIYFYGDICAQHQSGWRFGRLTVDQRNSEIRGSAQPIIEKLQSLLKQAELRGAIYELTLCLSNVPVPKLSYEQITYRIAQLNSELTKLKGEE